MRRARSDETQVELAHLVGLRRSARCSSTSAASWASPRGEGRPGTLGRVASSSPPSSSPAIAKVLIERHDDRPAEARQAVVPLPPGSALRPGLLRSSPSSRASFAGIERHVKRYCAPTLAPPQYAMRPSMTTILR